MAEMVVALGFSSYPLPLNCCFFGHIQLLKRKWIRQSALWRDRGNDPFFLFRFIRLIPSLSWNGPVTLSKDHRKALSFIPLTRSTPSSVPVEISWRLSSSWIKKRVYWSIMELNSGIKQTKVETYRKCHDFVQTSFVFRTYNISKIILIILQNDSKIRSRSVYS